MSEISHHDEFYANEAVKILDSPLFIETRKRSCCFLEKYGILSSKDRILSLGVGDGRIELQMAGQVGEIIGIDISSIGIQQAQERARIARRSNLHFTTGDIRKLRLSPASFDGIWALSFLHHIDENSILEILSHSFSLLKPGGIMVSCDPSNRRMVGFFRCLYDDVYRKYHSPDERELNISWLSNCFEYAGFKEVKVYYTDYFLGPLAWVYPGTHKFLVKPAAVLDSFFLRLPVVKHFASTFFLVGRKPR